MENYKFKTTILKNINKGIVLLAFLISIIVFFNLSITFELSSEYEITGERGCGFPFIWLMDHLGTSLYYVVDIVHLLIDFLLLYCICFVILLFVIKEPFRINEHKLLTALVFILALISFTPFFMIFTSFAEYYAIDDFEPIYSTFKLYFNIFFPINMV